MREAAEAKSKALKEDLAATVAAASADSAAVAELRKTVSSFEMEVSTLRVTLEAGPCTTFSFSFI